MIETDKTFKEETTSIIKYTVSFKFYDLVYLHGEARILVGGTRYEGFKGFKIGLEVQYFPGGHVNNS